MMMEASLGCKQIINVLDTYYVHSLSKAMYMLHSSNLFCKWQSETSTLSNLL